MKNLLVFLLLVCFFGGVSAHELDEDSYPECVNDEQCEGWYRCLQNICTIANRPIRKDGNCLQDIQCPGEDLCTDQHCTSITKFKKCTKRKQCKEDERCGRGYCRKEIDWLFAGGSKHPSNACDSSQPCGIPTFT